MARQRRIRITPIGWYYLMVLSFIVGAAVFRQSNLLVMLAGLMAAPLVLNWRLAAAMVQRLAAQRSMPQRICAGDPLVVELELQSARNSLGGWMLAARDEIRLEQNFPGGVQTTVDVVFPEIAAGGTCRASYRMELVQRGSYQFGPLQISSCFPFGLVEAQVFVHRGDTLLVCPRLGRLTNRWNHLIESERDGAQRAHRRRGPADGDYYGLREFRPGDSTRSIHWRTSAKLNELAVRLMERQRSRDVALVLDLWQPESPRPEHLDLVELAASFAATVLADLCGRGGSRLVLAGSGLEFDLRLAPASPLLLDESLARLATLVGSPEERLEPALAMLRPALAGGVRQLVISTRPAPPGAEGRAAMTWFDVSDDGRLAPLFQIN